MPTLDGHERRLERAVWPVAVRSLAHRAGAMSARRVVLSVLTSDVLCVTEGWLPCVADACSLWLTGRDRLCVRACACVRHGGEG